MQESYRAPELPQNNLSSASNVRLKDLFDSSRGLDKNNLFKFCIYLPFGFLLLVIRLMTCLLGQLALSFLPRTSAWNYIMKGVCKILGFAVNVDDKHLDDNAKFIVANHISILDRLAVNVLKPCNTVTKNFHVKNTDILSFWNDRDSHYYREFTENELLALQAVVESSSRPVLSFPERATTNGKVGLLKFQPAVFSFNFNIQPVIVQVSMSSFISISPSVIGSYAYADMLWPFFVPQIYYKIKVLPSMVKLPEESAIDFSKRVQKSMAKAMGIIPTSYTSADKFELLKQLRTSSHNNDSPSSSRGENLPSANQYSEILMRSRELACKQQLTLNTAAKAFGKSPKERMLSYKERKNMLIEAARTKYLQKKNLL